MNALTASGVDENTVVVLTNDNGGTTPYDNAPFSGGKGQLLEGGIRVPFIIRAPGVDADVYDRPITTLDLLPTFVSLAGGDPSGLRTDGVDLMPFLSGDSSGEPHEILFWRSSGNRFAVRKGDWKLSRPQGGTGPPRLNNLATDIRESTNLASQQPEIVAELRRELTIWEATLTKPQWYSFGAPTFNPFDHFVFRHDVSHTATWSATSQWRHVSGDAVTLMRQDAYANAVLEFQTNNEGDYVATNDMVRATLETFMLNEIRFTGEYGGSGDHQATIDGNDLLFVTNLEGQSPQIRLDAIAAPSAGTFSFQLDNDLQLLNELEITGDGTQTLELSGAIVDYFEPRGITKSGTSHVRLTGNNSYAGSTTVQAGLLSMVQPCLADVADVRIFSGATLQLDFNGIDTIGALYLDGVSQVAGTWGAPGNTAADFHTDLIEGGGLLYVAAAPAQGDLNGDGYVDAADYVAWRKELGTIYDADDYDIWLANFGASLETDAFPRQAVPEPAALWLVLALSALCLLRPAVLLVLRHPHFWISGARPKTV
jgi:autotransporter-associated beta strand protein